MPLAVAVVAGGGAAAGAAAGGEVTVLPSPRVIAPELFTYNPVLPCVFADGPVAWVRGVRCWNTFGGAGRSRSAAWLMATCLSIGSTGNSRSSKEMLRTVVMRPSSGTSTKCASRTGSQPSVIASKATGDSLVGRRTSGSRT